jgi:glycosyltransferase involved in cell wall biosynthesis
MLGWEFPPFISGGLGTACYGLTKALSQLGTQITFLLPRPIQSGFTTHVKLVSSECGVSLGEEFGQAECSNIMIRPLNVEIYPYGKPGEKASPVGEMGRQAHTGEIQSVGVVEAKETQMMVDGSCHQMNTPADNYGSDLYNQVHRYSNLACQIAKKEAFDVIHAHDWMTYPAGVAIEKMTGKPLVVHVHSTEFDRSGEQVNEWIYNVERQGMRRADQVITVSNLTKRICRDRYRVPEAKLRVVYNGVDDTVGNFDISPTKKDKDEKIVLFLGRITMQKGPEYFVAAARKVLEKMEDVKFIMAGSGDMFTRTIELVAGMGIGHKVLFTGFLRGADVDRAFKMADLYVMPSVSEPFGLSPLEAMMHKVPVIISKQSGVAEIIQHALKVDFWDIDEMANKMIAVLRHRPLRECLGRNGTGEAAQINWSNSAVACEEIYRRLIPNAA